MAGVIPFEMEPMLAQVQEEIPAGDDWEYEPKWDGFRTVVHRSGGQVDLISRGARPMTRYFPEVVESVRSLPSDVVLDGELIVIGADGLDFDALQQRIHPADSRIRLLAGRTPAEYVAFDLLAEDGLDIRGLPLSERRHRLEDRLGGGGVPVHLTPSTRDFAVARDWFERFEGAGLDGLIAKLWSQPYLAGKRAWVKVKHQRTADCVVLGYRKSSDGLSLGSLLLGLHDAEGVLQYVGHTSSFDSATRRRLLAQLEPTRLDPQPEWSGRMPGGPSRWSRGRDTEWVAVRPELVCEVKFDKLQSGQRFRHAAGFVRWRPDKPPAACTFDQVESVAHVDVGEVLGVEGA